MSKISNLHFSHPTVSRPEVIPKIKERVIEVVPYNDLWPEIFKAQADTVQQVLGVQCLALHHIGSTSVPGLCAKPIIDMIAVVKNESMHNFSTIFDLENIGFMFKGEINIPFIHFFIHKNEKTGVNTHLHVCEENHPEIELNLLFREYLRQNPEYRARYAQLKEKSAQDPDAGKKPQGYRFCSYTLGKDPFIRQVLSAMGYQGERFLKVMHHREWEDYHRIMTQHFDAKGMVYTLNPTFTNEAHFMICCGVETAAVAHIQYLNTSDTTVSEPVEAVLQCIAVDSAFAGKGVDHTMIRLLKKWFTKENIKIVE